MIKESTVVRHDTSTAGGASGGTHYVPMPKPYYHDGQCPHCGYCPTCGRGGYSWPPRYSGPYWTSWNTGEGGYGIGTSCNH